MKITVPLFISVLLTGSAIAHAEIDLSKMPPAATQKDLSYEKDIKPIFEASCFRCHGEKEKKGGIRLDSLEAVLKGGKEGKIVEAGNALKSTLLISVSQLDPENAMPPKPRARRNGQGGPGGERRERGERNERQESGDHKEAAEHGTNAPATTPARPAGPNGPRGNFPPAKPLTPEQVGLVRAWIDQGAK